MKGIQKVSFWLGVAGVSLLAHAGLELAGKYIPSPGFRRLVDFVHCGPGGQ